MAQRPALDPPRDAELSAEENAGPIPITNLDFKIKEEPTVEEEEEEEEGGGEEEEEEEIIGEDKDEFYRGRDDVRNQLSVECIHIERVQCTEEENSLEGSQPSSVCGKSVPPRRKRNRHADVHLRERRYECAICGTCFSQGSHLKRHLLTHTGAREHKCDVCGKGFVHRPHLKTHLLTHTGKREHKCEVCGKEFTQRCSLKTHSLTHTGEKPCVCPVCGKGFSRRDNLNRHVLTHSADWGDKGTSLISQETNVLCAIDLSLTSRTTATHSPSHMAE